MAVNPNFPNPNEKLARNVSDETVNAALNEMKKDFRKEQFEKARNDPNAYDSASAIDIELNSTPPKK